MREPGLLIPKVNEYEGAEGLWRPRRPIRLVLPGELKQLGRPLSESWPEDFLVAGDRSENRKRESENRKAAPDNSPLAFDRREDLPGENYVLNISKERAVLSYGSPQGAFYGLMTIRQLLSYGEIPCGHIEDGPALGLRGYMMDISRGKVPTLETLKETADLLASLKYNHMELYIEGMSFAYPSFERCWQDKTPLAPEEISEFAAYCKARFIELTPNQNSLGHMAPWLACPEFLHLAEKEEGLSVHGLAMPPTTLDCENPESLDFVEKLMDDLLPCFDSPLFNVGMDEPFELGKGKNAELAAKVGERQLYMNYVHRLHRAVSHRHKTMMMWDDIVIKEPEEAERLPDDIILLEWGYEASHPFDKRAKLLAKMGRKFCICPGTSGWHSVGGITDNMLDNVRHGASAAHRYGAMGLLLTDWGDGGHLQYLPVSWPAMTLTAALAWSRQELSEEELVEGLNRFVFLDASEKMGAVMLELGRYARMEEVPLGCRTVATLTLSLGPRRGRERFEKLLQTIISITEQMSVPEVAESFRKAVSRPKALHLPDFEQWEKGLLAMLSEAKPTCRHRELVKAEVFNAVDLIMGLTFGRAILARDGMDREWSERMLRAVEEHCRLWLARNKAWGLEEGAGRLRRMAEEIGRERA